MIIFIVFDEKIHWFQVKYINIIVLNSLFVLFEAHINPLISLVLTYMIWYNKFKRFEKKIEYQIDDAIEKDETLYFV